MQIFRELLVEIFNNTRSEGYLYNGLSSNVIDPVVFVVIVRL